MVFRETTHRLPAVLLLVFGAGIRPADATDVVITEILYNADPTNNGGEFLELFNGGETPADLSGWSLADAVTFTFADGSVVPAGRHIVVARNAAEAAEFYGVDIAGEYTGRLDNAGESVELLDANGQLIDRVRFGDRDPWPQEADGGGPSLELFDPSADNSDPASWGVGTPYSPGAPNSAMQPTVGEIVITEIMYKPKRQEVRERFDPATVGPYLEDGEDLFGEYVEFYNRSDDVVDLSGWTLSDGIRYSFPVETTLQPGSFLVVAADPEATDIRHRIESLGPFEGDLRDGGERLTLRNRDGLLVESVRFNDRHPWPIRPDEDGVSLERADPDSAAGSPVNWHAAETRFIAIPPRIEAAEEPGDDGWMFVTVSGEGTSSRLEMFAAGASEWLVDGIEIFDSHGASLLPNGSFETDDRGWTKSGNHSGSFRTSEDAKAGTGSFHIVAAGPGDSRLNFVHVPKVTGLTRGGFYSLSFWVKHLSGNRTLTARLVGGSLPAGVRWPSEPPGFDLERGWSDEENPNDVWAVEDDAGNAIEGRTASWNETDLGAGQSAWTADGGGVAGAPGWCRSIGAAPTLDFPEGRVGMLSPASVRFTLPAAGWVTIDGGVYLMRHGGGRGDQLWQILRGETVFAEGRLVSGETTLSSVTPQAFASGSGGEESLRFFARAGESLRFIVRPAKGAPGDFVGVDVHIDYDRARETFALTPIAGVLGSGTPGRQNSARADGLPPVVRDLEHFPALPSSSADVLVSALVTSESQLSAVQVEYSLTLRDGETLAVEMFDDGAHDDGEAGDGIYAGRIPAQQSETFVHYRVRAAESDGRETVFPYESDPSPTQGYFHYDGEIDTGVTLYHVYVKDEDLALLDAEPRSSRYVDADVAIDGKAYPHIGVRRRGRTTRAAAKLPWKFKFNRNDLADGNRVLDTQLTVPFAQWLEFQMADLGGITNLEADIIRVHLNGAFFGVYVVFEAPNSFWLRKHGYDGASEVYKARTINDEAKNTDLFRHEFVTDFDYWGAWNKKIKPLERPTHIRELVDALNDLSDEDLLPWFDRHVDYDDWFGRWVVYVLTNTHDFAAHNYHLFLRGDPGDGGPGRRWTMLGYDFDSAFTFGRNGPVRPYFGDATSGKPSSQQNLFYHRVSQNVTLRRIRDLKMQEVIGGFYQINDILAFVDEHFDRIAADREADLARWTQMRADTTGVKSIITSQWRAMRQYTRTRQLPTFAPEISPPGGAFDAPVEVALSVPKGWGAVYTTDGGDPRLSRSGKVYAAPFLVAGPTTVRAAGLRADGGKGAVDSGAWTDVAEAIYDLEPANFVGPFLRGDFDGDGRVVGDTSDSLFLLRYLFLSGPRPPCLAACDLNLDGALTVSDPVLLLFHAFRGGTPPPAPFPACGLGSGESDVLLGCELTPGACAQ